MVLSMIGRAWAAASFLLLAGTAAAAESKRPVVEILSPAGEERYRHSSNIGVTGDVLPAVDSTVDVTAYHVREDGGLVPLGRNVVRLEAGGQFACDLYPVSPGWRPGTVRVVVRLGVMPHLRAEREIAIVDPGKPPEDWVIYEKSSSGVVVDLADEKKAFVVPPGERFLVRWVTDGAESQAGQLLKIIGVREGRAITFDEGQVTWFQDGAKWWIEREFVGPQKEGTYEIGLLGRDRQVVRRVAVTVARSMAAAEPPSFE